MPHSLLTTDLSAPPEADAHDEPMEEAASAPSQTRHDTELDELFADDDSDAEMPESTQAQDASPSSPQRLQSPS